MFVNVCVRVGTSLSRGEGAVEVGRPPPMQSPAGRRRGGRWLAAWRQGHTATCGGGGALRPAGQRWSWGVQGTSESSGVEAEMQWAGNK